MGQFRDRRFGQPGPTLAEVGEAALLERLRAIATASAPRRAPSVPDDDGALWAVPAGGELVLSQDCQVEDVDFRREWIRPHQLGRRALAVAVSDLAAMGATPGYALATVCAPGSTPLDDVLAVQSGLCEAAAELGCAVIGGDVSDIRGSLVLDVSVGGTVDPGAVLSRDTGRPGDLLIVTGILGRAAAGLALLREPARAGVAVDDADAWVSAQLAPVARVEEGRALARAGARCAGDLSDGLWVDAGRTAAASRCGAEIWAAAVPVDPGLLSSFPETWFDLAVGGGEDFELLAAVPATVAASLRSGWPPDLVPLTVVGRLFEGSGTRCLERDGGRSRPAPALISRHYR